MKKFFISMSLLIVLALPSTAFADNQEIVITEAEDGCYYETIIEEIPAEYNILNPNAKAATNTKTGRKTTYYKNAADDVLWYVRVTGTFTGHSHCKAIPQWRARRISNKDRHPEMQLYRKAIIVSAVQKNV